MSDLQKPTQHALVDGDNVTLLPTYEQLNNTQQMLVDFKALNGLLINPDTGEMEKWTMTKFAEEKLKITRESAYSSIGSMPHFRDLVAERRKILATQARADKVMEVWFMSACIPGSKGFRDRMLYMHNFIPEVKIPGKITEDENPQTWSEFLRRKADRKIIEAQVVNDPNSKPAA